MTYPCILPPGYDDHGTFIPIRIAIGPDDVRGLTAAQLAALLAAPAPPDPAPLSTAERAEYERAIAACRLFIRAILNLEAESPAPK